MRLGKAESLQHHPGVTERTGETSRLFWDGADLSLPWKEQPRVDGPA